ncbi:MAG: hypothetical protein JRE40_11005, partial [Deltaproteobacteria bacterium]|nr:hypothetical protein [Deltaproteobacteria bacterium]
MAKRPTGLRIDSPSWPLLQAFVSYWGITDADGAAGGGTLVCSDLTNQPDFDGNQVVIISGDYAGQARDISGATTGGTVTAASAFGGQIVTGTIFAIVALRTVPAEVAALAADVGDASTSTLGSLYGILGNPAQDFLTMIGYEGATSLADKLTAARALLLDRLALLAAGGAGELTAARAAALQRLIDDLTAARAGYLDNINNPDLANVIREVAETTGTFSFDETNAGEQTVFTLTITSRSKIGGIWLDFSNLTQDVTIRVKHQIDGANYRTFQTSSWATTDDDGVLIEGFT